MIELRLISGSVSSLQYRLKPAYGAPEAGDHRQLLAHRQIPAMHGAAEGLGSPADFRVGPNGDMRMLGVMVRY